MPELPEVETVMQGLRPVLEGQTFLRIEQRRANLRHPLPNNLPQRLEGRSITALSRRAKYILIDLDDANVLIIHLGMTGRFQVESSGQSKGAAEFYYEGPRDPKHDHLVFHLSNGATLTFNDARRFGSVDLTQRASLEQHKSMAKLGVEPMGNRLDAAMVMRALAKRVTSLKAVLMDQGVIAGLGNIYVSEALFRAKLHPERSATTLTEPQAEALVHAIKAVLGEAIAAGGSTLRDFTHADGASGSFQERFYVYDRANEPCLVCGTLITRLVQAGRSTFLCTHCQPFKLMAVSSKAKAVMRGKR